MDSDSSRTPPFVPMHTWGLLIERGGMRLVVWQGDGAVEAAGEGSASEDEIARVRKLLGPLRVPGIKFSQVARLLATSGYKVIGDLRFDFRSGELYQDARTLATECFLANADAATISARHGNTNPPLSDPDWPSWEAAVRKRNATAKGARVLGVASLKRFAEIERHCVELGTRMYKQVSAEVQQFDSRPSFAFDLLTGERVDDNPNGNVTKISPGE